MPMDYYSSQMKPSPCLDNLPEDILIQILNHLDGRDLSVLRKSCKKLHAVTQRRTVWLNAVRRMCRRHGVFAPSFPLDDMSITELEHASLCPSRLSSLIHNGIPLQSFVTRILEPRTPSVVAYLEGSFRCIGACLIPGGRFLVVNSTHHGICLWDLGIHGGKVPRFRPVAVIPEVGRRLVCTGPTQDGLGIILISRTTSTSDRTLRAHEIYPCTDRPRFTLLGLIQYGQQAINVDRKPALYGDLFVFEVSPGDIVAWNTRLNTAIAWRHDHQGIYNMVIYEESIVLIQESELSVWDIPPLQPLSSCKYEIIDHPPRYAILYPSHEEIVGSSILGPWFSSIDPPISFGIFVHKDEECVMLWYTLKSINPSRDPMLPMVFPIKMGMVLNLLADAETLSDLDITASLQFCDDELCLFNTCSQGLLINLIAAPISLDGQFSSKTAVLFNEFEAVDNLYWSFCASSGRLVVVDAGTIRIMDFLVPPPS